MDLQEEALLEEDEPKWRSIEEEISEAEEIIEGMDLGENYFVKPYTDFDGPVKTRSSGSDEYHDGVREAFELLVAGLNEDILKPGIISGRGLGFLKGQVQKLDLPSVDVAGEMGAVYITSEDAGLDVLRPDDKDFVVSEEEEAKDDIYEFNRVLIEHLADHGLQMMYGDNVSNVVGSACIEARGVNLEEDRFSVEGTVYPEVYGNPTVRKVQDHIENFYNQMYSGQDGDDFSDHFEFSNDVIYFEDSLESFEVLTDVLSLNPFIPWRFTYQDEDSIAMFPAYEADESFGPEELEQFVTSVVQDYNEGADTEFWYSTYHDNSFDFGKKGYENMKSKAAKQMIDRRFPKNSVLVANTGDKPSDILKFEEDYLEALNFVQRGTEAHRYAERKDMDYVAVDSTVDSFRVISEIFGGELDIEEIEE